MADWKKRILTATIAVPLLCYGLTFSFITVIYCLTAGFVSLQEFSHIMKEILKKQGSSQYSSFIDNFHQPNLMYIPVALYLIAVYISTEPSNSQLFQFLAIMLISVCGLVNYLRVARAKELEDQKLLLLTFSYIAGYIFYFLIFVQPLSYIIEGHTYEKGYSLVVFWVISAFQSDNGALFVGSALGKHQFCPRISPKKTWEGVIGAILFCIMTNIIIYFCDFSFLPKLSLFHYIMIGLSGSIASVYGDLLESFVKRSSGIKDSGSIFPGHGGLLDRMDSLTFSAPIIFYYFKFFVFKSQGL